jgi:hypothetical protein
VCNWHDIIGQLSGSWQKFLSKRVNVLIHLVASHRRQHLFDTNLEDLRKISMSLPTPARSHRISSESSTGTVITSHFRRETYRYKKCQQEMSHRNEPNTMKSRECLALKVLPDADEENAFRDDRYVCSALAWETSGAQKLTWAGLNSFSLNDCHRALSRYNDDDMDTIQRANNTCKTGM